MLKEEWGIAEPRDFQLRAIEDIAFGRKDMFLIRKPAEGKSLVIQGVATILRNVSLVLVPVQGLGSDQVSKTMNLDSRVEAYHLDEMSDEDAADLKRRLHQLPHSAHLRQSIVLFASPQSLQQGTWKAIVGFLVENNLLSLFCIDEAHCVVTHGRSFRPEFKTAVQNVLAILKRFDAAVPKLSVSATLDEGHQVELREVLSYDPKAASNTAKRKRNDEPSYRPDVTDWGNMDRRGTFFRSSVHAVPTNLIKSDAVAALKKNKRRKILAYCNSRDVAEGTINKLMKEAIKEAGVEGLSIPFTGKCGIKLKCYLMHLFCGKSDDVNLAAMPGTASMNAGVSSTSCWLALAYGLPPSIYDVFQQMGRVDRLLNGAPGEGRYHIVLSLPLFMNLLVRVMQTADTGERARLKGDLFAVLRMLVIPTECYHIQLERALERPFEGDREPCETCCSFCVGDFKRDCQPFAQSDLVLLLQHQVFYEGPTDDATILQRLSTPKSKKKLFKVNNVKTLTQGKLHTIILQLMASEIIVPSVSNKTLVGSESLTKKDIVWNFGKTVDEDGDDTFVYNMQQSWHGFNCTSQS